LNGVRNGAFIILLMVILVVTDYMYSIADPIANDTYMAVNSTAGFSNPITDSAMDLYTSSRELIYTAITGVLVPFLTFLAFFSSAVNRNQNFTTYLISAFAVIIFTPVAIYVMSEVFTNMLSVSFLDPAYMFMTYINNFLWIMVANMILTLLSFIFVRQEGAITI